MLEKIRINKPSGSLVKWAVHSDNIALPINKHRYGARGVLKSAPARQIPEWVESARQSYSM
jgi:hypothetical protein